jgi:hypothetical protein
MRPPMTHSATSGGCGTSSARRWRGCAPRPKPRSPAGGAAWLGEERERLLHAYYAEAVPLDLHSEHERLSAETAQAEHQIEISEASFGDVEDTLGKALDLLVDCERAYRKVPGHLDQPRRGRRALADPRLPEQLKRQGSRRQRLSSGSGSSEAVLVELGGFEPPTSWVRSRRSAS